MKSFLAIAATCVATTTADFTIQLWTLPDCTGDAALRPVWHETCAPTGGFQSFRLYDNSIALPDEAAYIFSPNSYNAAAITDGNAAGDMTYSRCAYGAYAPRVGPDGDCFTVLSARGGSNAVGSYSAKKCPQFAPPSPVADPYIYGRGAVRAFVA